MKTHAKFLMLACLLFVALVPASWSETAKIPMRDGTKLATDYFLPTGEGPFPVILVRTVYGKNGMGAEMTGHVNALGCALVIQDARGRFESEGKDMVFADDGWGTNQDGVDTVNWVLQQPWCNGKIGTWGGSALGITQILTSCATPKVSAQWIDVAASNFYGQISYRGGVWLKALCELWMGAQRTADYRVPVWKSHPTYDDFWADYNAEAQVAKVTAPGVHVGGWWDCFSQGTINNFVTRQHNGGEGAKGNQKLIIGPWPHGPRKNVGGLKLPDNYYFDSVAYGARFMNYWLKGEQNGISTEPAVRYYTIGDVTDPKAPGNEWRTANDWPPFPTVETPYYLGKDGNLSTKPPKKDGLSCTFAYDPADPVPTKGGQNLELGLEDGPCDQRVVSNRPDVLRFATKPLTKPVEITGAVKVHLFVSTDAVDTDFTAKLIDIYPDGRETLMLDNIQRVKFRNGFTKPDLLPVGEIGELTIDLWSISLIFNKGHRIGVQISSSNYPRFEKNPNSGDDFPTDTNLRVAHNTVYVDKSHPSAILLPIGNPRVQK